MSVLNNKDSWWSGRSETWKKYARFLDEKTRPDIGESYLKWRKLSGYSRVCISKILLSFKISCFNVVTGGKISIRHWLFLRLQLHRVDCTYIFYWRSSDEICSLNNIMCASKTNFQPTLTSNKLRRNKRRHGQCKKMNRLGLRRTKRILPEVIGVRRVRVSWRPMSAVYGSAKNDIREPWPNQGSFRSGRNGSEFGCYVDDYGRFKLRVNATNEAEINWEFESDFTLRV